MMAFSGALQRPLSVVAVAAVAAVSSSEIPDMFSHHQPADTNVVAAPVKLDVSDSWASLDFVPSLSGPLSMSQVKPVTNGSCKVRNLEALPVPFASLPLIRTAYQYAKFVKPSDSEENMPVIPSSSPDVSYRWHLPDLKAYAAAGNSGCSLEKSQTVVVLLGWLGAKQKHLKTYAEWYTSRGFNAVTFTFPMSEVVSYKAGGKAEQELELLAQHLVDWAEENGKKLVFHTFSNTGWLTYGVILEKFQNQDPSFMEKIKGCIVDSAPVAAPDPQVWAAGFSAAFLKKHSVATKGSSNGTRTDVLVLSSERKPAATEAALLAVLEKFFEVILNLPAINRRLADVSELLSLKQPKCPQLYIYSSADRVIPVKSVESFVDRQRRAGYEVRACDFLSSPHVDHFRSHPGLYSSQLTSFLDDCVLTCCKDSS